jgi:hypothetical protein
MTKLMEKALDAVRAWPADRQDEAAKLLLALDRLGPGPTKPPQRSWLPLMKLWSKLSAAKVEATFARFRK